MKIKCSPSGGLEPPTFRLTVERASQLRHEGSIERRRKKIGSEIYWDALKLPGSR